ncbi:Lysosome-associated membrane glycoprotein 3 [Oryzias melastigma]|uniref:Lysosome-associated membrane glycoprotein 3 n=1 Tax=Oryzias melastigma TaxID=30732 RepID=A0A834C940_ORYME|nr:Lysosome-associated membrane glycoprotein 3 [Oryzias melastigma]
MNAQTYRWPSVLLAVLIPCVLLQRTDGSLSEAHIYQPILNPNESVPSQGSYAVKNYNGSLCVTVVTGVEYIITENKINWYFNLDPSGVKVNGYCGKDVADISLTLPGDAASLQFNFKKKFNKFYVSQLNAHLSPQPLCKGCINKTYSGQITSEMLFLTPVCETFKSRSGFLISVSPAMKIKLVPLQMKAFILSDREYGLECLKESKKIIAMVMGAVVMTLIFIVMLSFLFIRDRRRQGYERM